MTKKQWLGFYALATSLIKADYDLEGKNLFCGATDIFSVFSLGNFHIVQKNGRLKSSGNFLSIYAIFAKKPVWFILLALKMKSFNDLGNKENFIFLHILDHS